MFTGALYFKMVNLKHAWHIQLYTVMTESQVLGFFSCEKIMNFSVTYSYQANKVARKKMFFLASTATVGTCIYYFIIWTIAYSSRRENQTYSN